MFLHSFILSGASAGCFLFEPAVDAASGAGSGGGGSGGSTEGGGSSSVSSVSSSGGSPGTAAPGAGATAGAPAAPGGFDFRTLANEKGEFTEGWQEKLPAEYDPYRATLANYRSFDKLAGALLESKKAAMARTDGMVKVPGKDARPEEVAAYRQAVGVPETPEAYGLRAPEQLPEGLEWNEGFAKNFSTKAHELGLSKAQVEALASWHLQEEGQRAQHIEQEGSRVFESQMSELKRDFGDQFEKRLIDARRAALTLGLPDDHPVFFRADTVRAMARLADLISEDRLPTHQQMQNKLSPGTVAMDVMTNPDHPDYQAYYNPGHGRHREVVAFVTEQMKREYPGK